MVKLDRTTVDQRAQTIWDYMKLGQPLQKADVLLVLGSNDLRVADHAANVFLEGWAPIVVCSGNVGRLTDGMWGISEARMFADRMIAHGVPKEKILLEEHSTNTGENVIFSRTLLFKHDIVPHTVLVAQKPYMERRAYATFKKVWPEPTVIVTSPSIPFSEYPNEDLPRNLIINIMVGDLQRIREYPKKGFQIPQEIPDDVWQAYEQLVGRGYTKHLIPESKEKEGRRGSSAIAVVRR